MPSNEIGKKLMHLALDREERLETLERYAQAAANQMSDAGMTAGAAALNEALFQYQALTVLIAVLAAAAYAVICRYMGCGA